MVRDLDDLESCLLRLDAIASQCHILLWIFERCGGSGPDSQRARALLHEDMVLQAYHLARVRRHMCRNERFAEIDRIAKPLVQIALDHEPAIKEARDNYVAHMQERGRFKMTLEGIFDKHNAPFDYASWLFLIKGIQTYALFVVCNFEEFEEAGIKYEERHPSSTQPGISLERAETEFHKIFSSVQQELTHAGFKTVLDKGLLQRMKDGSP